MNKNCVLSGILLIILIRVISIVDSQNCASNNKVVACYYSSWSVYRPGNGTHQIEYIDPTYCSHLIYTFVGLNIDGVLILLDAGMDLNNGGFKRFLDLKKRNPCLKTLIAVGGWGEGSEKYSLMAETEENRERFAESVLRFLVFYGFDGIDIDWEYPASRGGLSEDRENFIKLLELLKTKLNKRKKILTGAVAAPYKITSSAYNITAMCSYMDYVFVMGYDMHDDLMATIHAPLKREKADSSVMETLDDTITYYINEGCPTKKLVLGIPAFGRTFTLRSSTQTTVRSAVKGKGNAGPYTKEEGFLGYNEICEAIKWSTGWTTVYLENNAAKYAFKGTQWVSYDDPVTVTKKSIYARARGLAGVMLWSIDTDDFNGDCHSISYPLLAAANNALENKIIIHSRHL